MSDRIFLRLADDPLYAPETTVPADTMQEFAVPAALAPFVANAMGYQERLPPGAEVTERVLPDGALRLIVDAGGDGAPSVRVVGPHARAAVLTHRGDLQGLSLTLRPGASRALFRVAAHELAGRACPWDDIAAGPARQLTQRLLEPMAPGDRMDVVLRVLHESVRTVDPPGHERIRAAMHLLRGSTTRRPVHEVAAALGLGERRVEQLFREHVGLTPKTWHRLARFHECVRLLRRQPVIGWAGLAAEAGFHDQAHLANEFRAVCGLTPGQFVAGRGVAGFSKTAA